jgi:DNA-binding transcriptional LysR family regulator
MPDDLDLRKLRYFVAVAEELNFGRAADRLHLGQPALSRQIRVLETDLRTTLFDRDSHGTRLTEAGTLLLEDARIVLGDAALIRRRLARVGSTTRSLTVGVMPGLLATSAVAAFEAAIPGCPVSVIRLGWSTQVDAVRTGEIDVAYAREMSETAGLAMHRLLEEPRDVVLPLGHALGSRDTVSPDDLRGDLLLQDSSVAPEWVAVASELLRRKSAKGAAAETVEAKLELVAAGRGFVVLPRSTTAAYRRPDITVVPSVGFSPSRVSLVWRSRERDELRDSFIDAAIEHASRTLAG